MSIKIDSTTDDQETVTAATGELVEQSEVVESEQSASSEEQDETDEESGDSSEGDEELSTKSDDDDADKDEGDDKSKLNDRPKKSNGFKKRIDKLNSKLSLKEQEIEYWKAEALKQKQSQDVVKPKAESSSDKPSADNFESHEEYVEALADWKVEQKLKAHEQGQKESQLKTEFQRQIEAHQERVETFKAQHDDFDELMDEVEDIPMSITVQEVILASDNGPALMYALAKNPEEYKRICSLSAIAAARELGRFEAKSVESLQKPKPIKKTKAPAPLKTVSAKSSGSGKKSIYDPNLSQAEYERLREEQEARRG